MGGWNSGCMLKSVLGKIESSLMHSVVVLEAESYFGWWIDLYADDAEGAWG